MQQFHFDTLELPPEPETMRSRVRQFLADERAAWTLEPHRTSWATWDTAELALLLMLAAARNLSVVDAATRADGFQAGTTPGFELESKVLGLLGLGRLGRCMARYNAALGMEVIAWSQNLTDREGARR